jgi:hypothetical protein
MLYKCFTNALTQHFSQIARLFHNKKYFKVLQNLFLLHIIFYEKTFNNKKTRYYSAWHTSLFFVGCFSTRPLIGLLTLTSIFIILRYDFYSHVFLNHLFHRFYHMLLSLSIFNAWNNIIHKINITNNWSHDLKTSPFNIFPIINTIKGPI